MALAPYRDRHQSVDLLQRSLGRGRLAHAYLFTGDEPELLEGVARNLAKVIQCQNPPAAPEAAKVDCCDVCHVCRRIDAGAHPDLLWLRPESRSRVILIDQIRQLLRTVSLKPAEARTKIGIVEDADRMNLQAANAFLKTLEEPPGDSVLILLSTRPQDLPETILSRCLLLRFGAEERKLPPRVGEWLKGFAERVVRPSPGGLSRYRLLSHLLEVLGQVKDELEERLREHSPLERMDEVDSRTREKWEDELKAAVESDYRRLRADFLVALERLFRDVWLKVLGVGEGLRMVPEVSAAVDAMAARSSPQTARHNLNLLEKAQQLLGTNLQESLVLEVLLLQLKM